jgi:hypothetical protein
MALKVGVGTLFLPFICLPLVLDSNSWQEHLGAGILVSLGILLVRWQRRREATREVGNVRLAVRSHNFTNATSCGAYVRWAVQELFRGLPFSLLGAFSDVGATDWVARRFRPRLDSFHIGYDVVFCHISFGLSLLGFILIDEIFKHFIGTGIPKLLVLGLANLYLFKDVGHLIFEEATLDQAPNPLARRAGELEMIFALTLLPLCICFLLPFMIMRPTSIILWSILFFFVGLYVFLLRRYAQKLRIERLNEDWR